MKKLYTLLSLIIFSTAVLAQNAPDLPISAGSTPVFQNMAKAAGDSCGAYFNNYIGLEKTSTAYIQELRTGNVGDASWYGGMAQHFFANQPIEVSGIEFYAYQDTPGVDSLMTICILNEYDAGNDSVGVELARDTVYVKHTTFSILLPNISVQSYFDAPVTVTADYVVTVENATDSSLQLIVSDPSAFDGQGEGLGFYYYNNPNYPSFINYTNQLTVWGAAWDFDALINPLVKFDLNDGFILSDDTICPNVVGAACVNYTQLPNYADNHYNGYATSQTDHIFWLWGDGFQNTNITTACHTYANSGDFNITLRDTFRRHDFNSPICVSEVIMPIHVIPDVIPSFTFIPNGTIVDFTNTSTSSDSVWWDFGDTLAGSGLNDPQHTFPTIGTYDVWLHAFNECSEDSIMIQVTVDDVSIENYDFNFKVYPNPSNNSVNITGLTDGASVELINILGESIRNYKIIGSSINFPTEELSNGTYFLRVSTSYGQVTKKLLVRH